MEGYGYKVPRKVNHEIQSRQMLLRHPRARQLGLAIALLPGLYTDVLFLSRLKAGRAQDLDPKFVLQSDLQQGRDSFAPAPRQNFLFGTTRSALPGIPRVLTRIALSLPVYPPACGKSICYKASCRGSPGLARSSFYRLLGGKGIGSAGRFQGLVWVR